MKNKWTKALALALSAAMLLSACDSSSTKQPEPAKEDPAQPATQTPVEQPTPETNEDKYQIKDLVMSKVSSRELESWNILRCQSEMAGENLIQCVDGLVEVDNHGKLIPGIAESWETNDEGKTWTFHLRQGVKWVDWQGNVMADCTAKDWLTAMEWILNFYKNESYNSSMPREMIQGATEYVEYTTALSEAEAQALNAEPGSKFLEMVGIEAPDDYTLVYHCVAEKPYFETLAACECLYPMNQGAVDAAGGPKEYAGVDNTGIWYNGPYTVTEYINANTKVFTKNPEYWDTESYRFDTVTYRYVDSNDVAYTLFENGEIDYVDLTESNLSTILNDPNHKYADNYVHIPTTKYAYSFLWNYNKLNDDQTPDLNWNKAIANTAFRQSILYGLDLTEVWHRQDPIDPLICENNTFTMKGLCYTSDGKDYTQLVRDNLGVGDYNGETMVRLNKEKFEALKAQAMEELTAVGVTFPVHMRYFIKASNQTALDDANVMKNAFSQSLGDDYIVMDIDTYVSSSSKEVTKLHRGSVSISGWGADYGDPMNYVAQIISGYPNAAYAANLMNPDDITDDDWAKECKATYDEFTRLVWEADAINGDLDARYNAFAKAEAYAIENGLIIPHYYKSSYCLTKINLYSRKNAMYGGLNPKMKNWETKADEPYTQAEWQVIVDDYNANN